MWTDILYLYGFASGPLSNKAQFFKEKLSVKTKFYIYDYIPDMESFINLKTSNLLKNMSLFIEKNFPSSFTLFGSSFGGLIALWYTSQHPEKVNKLILMAPALRFSATIIANLLEISPKKWKEAGYASIMHHRYNKEVPLSYSFYEDLLSNPPPNFYEKKISAPTLIFHGKYDEVIPILWSEDYEKANKKVVLHELASDHQLLDQKEKMLEIIEKFL